MFFAVSVYAVPLRNWAEPDYQGPGLRKIHYAAAIIDTLFAVIFLAVGIIATQGVGYLPINAAYVFIGAGVAYLLGACCPIPLYIKMINDDWAPNLAR